MRSFQLRLLCALVLLPAALGAIRRPAAVPVSYAAPAGALPAGHLHGATFDAVLPSGRIVTPFGENAVVGVNALGVALSPDGRFAIVSCDDDRNSPELHSLVEPGASGGFALTVVDVATMRIVDRYRPSDEAFWLGVVALPDPARAGNTLVLASGGPSNAVFAFDLDADGHLSPDRRHAIAIPTPTDPRFADLGRSAPGAIVLSRDGRRAYVVNTGAGTVAAIDTRTRTVSGPVRAVGFFPSAAALSAGRLLVTDEGLMRYGVLTQPAAVPSFAPAPENLMRASALSFASIAPGGDLTPGTATAFGGDPALPMDPSPDGLMIAGGAHPTAVTTTPDGAYAFVAMTGVDRIATVSLGITPQVVGGTELRLFDRGPYGMQPSALALSRDGTRLYVALAGIDAIAVIDARDPVHLHRLGLIPTGWYPTALALAADDRTLYVLNTKGYGHDPLFSADAPTTSAVWSTLQKIDLSTVRLESATLHQLANTRSVVRGASRYPRGIERVVVILEEDKTFDAMLGDLGAPVGEPSLAIFPRAVTPNLHALAERYALAVNFFTDADSAGIGMQSSSSGMSSLFAQRRLFNAPTGAPPDGADDPEDALRLGSIFNALDRHRIPFRDYGQLLRLTGYDDGRGVDPGSATLGLGGWYADDVPASPALAGSVDLSYPGWNPRISDVRRAQEFMRDDAALASQGPPQPRYTAIWLPGDRGVAVDGAPPPGEQVADGDRALGMIVQYLSHQKAWKQTVVFILPADAATFRDHVDPSRAYAIVAGPFARRHYRGGRHLATASVLKTSEALLHLGTLSLGDLLASDMSDFFTARGDARPYTAQPVATQTALGWGP